MDLLYKHHRFGVSVFVLPSYFPAGSHFGVFDFFADDDYMWLSCFGSVSNLVQFSKKKVVKLSTNTKKKTVRDSVRNTPGQNARPGSEFFDPPILTRTEPKFLLLTTPFAQTLLHAEPYRHRVLFWE